MIGNQGNKHYNRNAVGKFFSFSRYLTFNIYIRPKGKILGLLEV